MSFTRSPGAQSSRFEELPLEIVAYIFELAYESERQRMSEDMNGCVPIPSIFAARDVSHQVRAKTLGHAPIWRIAAEILLTTAHLRGSAELTRAVSLCADYSGHTLKRIDLTRIGTGIDVQLHARAGSGTSRLCFQQVLNMIQIISPSAESVEELRLPRDMWHWGKRCRCTDCAKIQYTNSSRPTSAPGPHMDVDAGIWQLVCKAKSLKVFHLPFSGSTSRELLSRFNIEMEARPKDLRLIGEYSGSREPPLLMLFAKLASNVRQLQLEDPHCVYPPNAPSLSCWVPSLVVPVASTLRELQLFGDRDELDIARFFQHDYPVLQKLSLGFLDLEDGPDFRPPVIRRKSVLPMLCSLETPAWSLSYFHLPRLRAIAVTHLDREYEDIVIDKLRQCSLLEDLMLNVWSFEDFEHQHHNRLETSRMLQRIMHGLASANVSLPLQRLFIMNGQFRRDEWLLDSGFRQCGLELDGFDRENGFHNVIEQRFHVEEPQCAKKSGYLENLYLYADAPAIGRDLLHLPRSLKTINISGCLVEPQIWASMRAESGCENMSCNPPPFCLEQIFVRDKEWMLNEKGYQYYAALRELARNVELVNAVNLIWTSSQS